MSRTTLEEFFQAVEKIQADDEHLLNDISGINEGKMICQFFRKIVLATLHTNILIRRDLDATRKQTNPSHKTTLN